MNVLQQIPDFILAPSYVYLLVRIQTSHDDFFHSTFFKFFLSAGICSLCSTLPFLIFSLTTFPVSIVWLYWILWVVNAVGAIGSTVNKFYMCLHRYFVLRDIAVNEDIWSTKLVNFLIAMSYIVLILINLPVPFLKYVSRLHDGVQVVLTTSSTGTLLSKIYSSITYIVYCVGTVFLTILTSRHLSKLSKLVEVGNTRKTILRKQKIIFVVVACCTISHCLKCAHQIFWSYLVFTNTLTADTYDNFIFPMYILTNALANYTAPITLVIISNKHLLLSCVPSGKDEGERGYNCLSSDESEE